MKVYTHILTWNDSRYLPDLFESFESQSFKDFSVRIIDNGSTDGTLEFIQKHHPQVLVGRNVKNLGFATGHNQLVRFTLDHLNGNEEDGYVLIMNSDMILDKECIGRLVKALNENPEISVCQPKVYRAFGENQADETLKETIFSDILDTTGLRVQKGWRMTDRGAGEMDEGQFDKSIDIFGASGAIFLIRLSALKDALEDGGLFDDSFFAYREDCDLAWRLRRLGHKTIFVPDAKLHHYRGMYGAEKQTFFQRIKNRRSQRPFFAALSTRNQLFMLVKNLSVIDAFLSFPWIILKEGFRIFYGFVFELETRKRLVSAPKYLPSLLKKRKNILTGRKVKDGEIRKYVGN